MVNKKKILIINYLEKKKQKKNLEHEKFVLIW